MNTLHRKLLRDLFSNRYMLLAVSGVMAVGIACFVGMITAAGNLEHARSGYYSTCRLADFWIDLKKAPVQEVRRAAELSGISELRERIAFQVVLDLNENEKPVGAMLLSMPDARVPVINDIVLRSGTWFTPGRANEVIVYEKFARARNILPGDTISAVLNNQRRDLIVVGTAISAEFVYNTSPGSMVDEPGSYGLLYIKKTFAEDVFGFTGACNSVVGLLAPEMRSESSRIVKKLADRLEPYGVYASLTRKQQFSPMVLDNEMKQLANMAYIFPLFFLVVAALVLNVLMVRLVQQQRTVIGTLKAVGYTNRDLMIHFLQFAIVTGLAGGAAGCLFGMWLGSALTRMYVEWFTFPQLISRFYPAIVGVGILVAVVFAMLGTIKGVLRIMRLEPAEAMRQEAPAGGGSIFLERFGLLWKRLGSRLQMTLRTLFRNKGRSLIAIFAAAMGSSIVVLAFGFVDSMDEMVHLHFDKVLTSDYHLNFNSELSDSALAEVNRLPGVTRVEPVLNVACTFIVNNHRKKGMIMGIPHDARLTTPTGKGGEAIDIPGTGLLMTGRLMDQLHLQPGDYVNVLPVKGEQIIRKLPVYQTIESMLGLAVYADYNWLNRVFGEQGSISEIRVSARHDPVGRALFMRRVKEMPGLENVTDLGEQKAALNKQLNGAMRASALFMILFAAVIFFGTIMNGTLIALSERRRETATLRIIGYDRGEVGRLFLLENMVVNIVGTFLGLPLGYWLLHASMQGFVSDAYSFPSALAPASYFYTVVLAIVFVLLSQVVVRVRLKKQNLAEELSVKE